MSTYIPLAKVSHIAKSDNIFTYWNNSWRKYVFLSLESLLEITWHRMQMHNTLTERKMVANNNTIIPTNKHVLEQWNIWQIYLSSQAWWERAKLPDFLNWAKTEFQLQTGQVSKAKQKVLRAKTFNIWSPNRDLTKGQNTMAQRDAQWVCHKNNHFLRALGCE